MTTDRGAPEFPLLSPAPAAGQPDRSPDGRPLRTPVHDVLQDLAADDTEWVAAHQHQPGLILSVMFTYLDIQIPTWMDQAACRGRPTGWWFPERGEDVERAKAICETCPVKVECLEYAVKHRIRVGIWGGTTASGRIREWRAVKKARKEPTPPDP